MVSKNDKIKNSKHEKIIVFDFIMIFAGITLIQLKKSKANLTKQKN